MYIYDARTSIILSGENHQTAIQMPALRDASFNHYHYYQCKCINGFSFVLFVFFFERYIREIEYLGHLHIIKLRMFTLIIFYRFFFADCLIDALRLLCLFLDSVDERSPFQFKFSIQSHLYSIKLAGDMLTSFK